MIAAFFIAIILMVGLFVIYVFDDEKDWTFVVGLSLVALIVLGIIMGKESPKSSKKKIEPKIKIECLNNKCDTTYIYE